MVQYSSFDNELNCKVAAAIQNTALVADMTATNYHGLVWFSDELGYWCIEIWQNNMFVQTHLADDLEELICEIRLEYGSL